MCVCTVSVACLVLYVVSALTAVRGQGPVFLGQYTPAVQPQYSTNPAGAATMFPGITNQPTLASGIWGRQFVDSAPEPWAPGEPLRLFPSTPQEWLTSCQRLGCSEPGTHCVFWGSLCPGSVRRVPCRCQIGCRVDSFFIPIGQTRVMDACNNICTCRSLEGVASCTARRC